MDELFETHPDSSALAPPAQKQVAVCLVGPNAQLCQPVLQLRLRDPALILTVESHPQVLETHFRHLEHALLGAVTLSLLVDHSAQSIDELSLLLVELFLRRFGQGARKDSAAVGPSFGVHQTGVTTGVGRLVADLNVGDFAGSGGLSQRGCRPLVLGEQRARTRSMALHKCVIVLVWSH